MGIFTKVATKDELGPGTGKTVSVGDTPIAIFNVDGSFYAIHNTCLHMQGPLGEGDLDGKTVTCPWHAWRYEVDTGTCTTNPKVRVRSFEVKVDGEDVLVALDQE